MNIYRAIIISLIITSLGIPCFSKASNNVQSGVMASSDNSVPLSLGGTSGSIPGASANTCVLSDTQYTVQADDQGPCATTFIEISANSNPQVNLYVRFGQKVAMEGGNIIADYKSEVQRNSKMIVLTPPYEGGTYYIALSNCSPEPASYSLSVGVAIVDYFGPVIKSVSANGNRLLVSGCFFGETATIMLNGEEQQTVYKAASEMPTLIAKKGGKKIALGESVSVQVRDSRGIMSAPFTFTRTQE